MKTLDQQVADLIEEVKSLNVPISLENSIISSLECEINRRTKDIRNSVAILIVTNVNRYREHLDATKIYRLNNIAIAYSNL